jgi:CDP-diglyceride synthetase
MIFVFLSILYSHHWVVVAFLLFLQVSSFRELLGVRYKEVKEVQLPYFRTLSWFAFFICEFSAYGLQV